MPRRKIDPPRGVLKTSAVERQRFEHARYHPSPDLARYVEHYWAVQWDLRGTPPHEVETLPHPSVHLVFERGGNGRIAGVAKGRFTTRLEGSGGVFAAKFRPGGFRPFTRTPISTYTDRTVTLGSVWGSAGDGLERTVLALNDDDERMQVVEAFLRARLPEQDELVTQVAAIVELIAADRTILAVDDVARRFGLNLRALQRLFAEYVGVNPKWVIQRYRLHEAAEQLARGPINQAALALELGYADQAHFVKDFKATVGTSPAAYAKRAQDIR
jgi:AraC-like DNA-binding protein